jgi:cellulose synthase/poly-beta-1,6-N-acetylglucosamine synthase-like glycosyltransferase
MPIMKISLLVPCYNEEKSIEACIQSCLNQRRKFDQLIFVDDSSNDRTPEILARYADKITVQRTPQNTGNKSSAQEFGLQFVTEDILVTTDGDTLLDAGFAEEIEKSLQDPNVAAVAGRIKSLPHNWLTLCRAFDYVIGQSIIKLAQNYMNYIFVMPGPASAFRTEIFRAHITFDHDTITEDLDFTYKLHRKFFKIIYNKDAIAYTQDPTNLKDYINQMRRWFGGGWQNLIKHYKIVTTKPIRAFELSLMYAEGLIFSALVFVLPILNLWFGLWLIIGYLIVALSFAIWASWKEKRWQLMLAPFPYLMLMFINSYIFLEQFVKEVILKRKNLLWFKPERVDIDIEAI